MDVVIEFLNETLFGLVCLYIYIMLRFLGYS